MERWVGCRRAGPLAAAELGAGSSEGVGGLASSGTSGCSAIEGRQACIHVGCIPGGAEGETGALVVRVNGKGTHSWPAPGLPRDKGAREAGPEDALPSTRSLLAVGSPVSPLKLFENIELNTDWRLGPERDIEKRALAAEAL
jgi:hypothetical protein